MQNNRGGGGGGGGEVCRQIWQQREDCIFVINLLSYILWYTATKPMINRKLCHETRTAEWEII